MCVWRLEGHQEGKADCYMSPFIPSWILTEHIYSVGGRSWLWEHSYCNSTEFELFKA